MDDRCDLLCLDLERAEDLRRRRPPQEVLRRAADRAQGFADPTRLQFALALRDAGELCVCDLGWISERSQNLVSHHLRVLRSAGLAKSRRDGKMVMYELTEIGEALLGALAGAETGVAS